MAKPTVKATGMRGLPFYYCILLLLLPVLGPAPTYQVRHNILSLLPSSQQVNKRHIQTASKVLVSWLSTTPLPSVYTHHPALLHWVFSEFCPKRTLQLDLVMLWMKDTREPSVKQIESHALVNKDTTLCLLDVLNCGSEDVTFRLMTILKTIRNRENYHRSIDMGISIWDNLAKTLSVLFTPQPEAKVHNVACVVNLACRLVPSVDTATLLRVSNQLLRTFHIGNIDSDRAQTLYSQLFKSAYVLLLKMNQFKDNRVLETLIQNMIFIRALLSSLESCNQLVLLPAIKLIAFLHYLQRLHSIQVRAPQHVKCKTMLRLVADSGTKLASLDLISQLLTSSRIYPILDLPPVFPEDFIDFIYFVFQNLTVTNTIGWRGQTLLLQHCQAHHPNLEINLLTNYPTYLALQLALEGKQKILPELPPWMTANWLCRTLNGLENAMLQEYLQVWLAGIERHRGRLIRADYSRALCQDLTSMILTLLATSLVQQEVLPDTLTSIATKICNIGGNIPKNVIQPLKTKIQKQSKFSL